MSNTAILTMNYVFDLSGDRDTIREAINWCFDNLSGQWGISDVCDHYGEGGPGCWAEFALTITEDRDAVLFKTFWNDR